MTERLITDALDAAFVDRLNGEYLHVRDNHVSRLLAVASGVGDTAYLDAALEAWRARHGRKCCFN